MCNVHQDQISQTTVHAPLDQGHGIVLLTLIHIVYSLVMFTQLVPHQCISLHTWFQLKTSFINIVNNCSGTLGFKLRHSIVHLLVYSSSLSGLVYTCSWFHISVFVDTLGSRSIHSLFSLSVCKQLSHTFPLPHWSLFNQTDQQRVIRVLTDCYH